MLGHVEGKDAAEMKILGLPPIGRDRNSEQFVVLYLSGVDRDQAAASAQRHGAARRQDLGPDIARRPTSEPVDLMTRFRPFFLVDARRAPSMSAAASTDGFRSVVFGPRFLRASTRRAI